jgi:hypothetical protein
VRFLERRLSDRSLYHCTASSRIPRRRGCRMRRGSGRRDLPQSRRALFGARSARSARAPPRCDLY